MDSVILIDDDPVVNAEVIKAMQESMIAYWASMGITLVRKTAHPGVQNGLASEG